MDDHSFKSAWNAAAAPHKTQERIKPFMQEKHHPVLKKMRVQLILETLFFTALLFVYYDIFDGHTKPLYANVLLALSMMLVIVHDIVEYVQIRRSSVAGSVQESLTKNINRLKKQGLFSIVLRGVNAVCFQLFFVSVIQFTTAKYWLLAFLLLVVIIQVCIMVRFHHSRMQQLQESLHGLEG